MLCEKCGDILVKKAEKFLHELDDMRKSNKDENYQGSTITDNTKKAKRPANYAELLHEIEPKSPSIRETLR